MSDELVVDNSILSATARCHTYSYVRYALGLRTRVEALALEAGSAIHVGMEHWMTDKQRSVPKAVQAMAEYYEPVVASYLRSVEQDRLGKDDARFEPERVEAIFHQHLTQLSEQFPFLVIKGAVEKPVSAVLRPGILYVARLDAIVRRSDAGEKWSFDHKSTRKITDWWKDKQKVSSQWSGQVWIGKQQESEHNLAGIILHVIELPEPHVSGNTCREHKVPYTECSIRHAGYDYIYVTRSEPELEAWELSANRLATQYQKLVKRAGEEGIEGVREVSMQGRFNEGCVFCDMKEWCRLGRNTSERVVRATFQHSEWNPLKQKEVVV